VERGSAGGDTQIFQHRGGHQPKKVPGFQLVEAGGWVW